MKKNKNLNSQILKILDESFKSMGFITTRVLLGCAILQLIIWLIKWLIK